MVGYRWFVAQALAGLEATAIYHLTRAGITAFSPVVASLFEGRPTKLRLFPGYVFVELEAPGEAGIVNRTRGIYRVLPIHARDPDTLPLALPIGFVEELREKISGGSFDESAEASLLRKFIPDQEVTILFGPFAEHRGKFLRYQKGAGVVLTALLGRDFELKVPLHHLSPAGKSYGRGARRVEQYEAA